MQKFESVPSRFTNGGGILLFTNFLDADEIARARAYKTGQLMPDIGETTGRYKLEIPENSEFATWLFDKIMLRLIQPDVIDAIEPWTDFAWRSIYNCSPGTMEAGISKYIPGHGYRWHVDHATELRRVLNFIINLTTVHAGELLWTTAAMPPELMLLGAPDNFDPYIEGHVNPIAGQMVVMPAHYPHKVLPSPENREVLHGHMRL